MNHTVYAVRVANSVSTHAVFLVVVEDDLEGVTVEEMMFYWYFKCYRDNTIYVLEHGHARINSGKNASARLVRSFPHGWVTKMKMNEKK